SRRRAGSSVLPPAACARRRRRPLPRPHLRTLERLRHHGQPRLPGWLLWSAVPAILLIVAFGLWLRLEARGPTPIDMSWLDLAGLDRDTVPYGIAVVLAEVGGGTGAVACTGVLAAIFALRRRF